MERSRPPRSGELPRSGKPSRFGDATGRRKDARNRPDLLNRRRVLRCCGLVGLSGLAGCTRDIGEEFPPNEKVAVSEWRPDLPVAEKTGTLEAGIDALSGTLVTDVAAFEATLSDHGVTIASTERVLDVLEGTYVAERSQDRGVFYGIGRIAGAYAALVEAGYDARLLELTVRQPAGSAYGAAAVETKHAKRYNGGDLSASEYGEVVAQSLESKRRA